MNGLIGQFIGTPFECEVLPIKDGDTLVIKVDPNKVDIDTSVELYQGICNMYPNNKVIFIHEGMSLTKEEEPKEPVQLEYEGFDEYYGPWGKCPVCGHSNRDFDGYCSYCGTKIKGSGKRK